MTAANLCLEAVLIMKIYNCTRIDNCEAALRWPKMQVTNLGRRQNWVAEQYG